MANFNKAFEEIIGVEGKYVNNPADKGGPTNWGITQKTLSGYLGHSATIAEVQALSLDVAQKIYKRNYWDAMNLDLMESELIAGFLFDQGVNAGVTTIAKKFQTLLNSTGAKLTVDGNIGPATRLAMSKINELELANKFIQVAQDNYADIVARDSSQTVFIRGWINRSQILMDKLIKFALGGNAPAKEDVIAIEPVTSDMDLRQKVYATALKEVGQKEIVGGKHNPRVLEYHKATTLKASSDEVAWCSSFVNWCMKQNGVKGTELANARSFLKWGKATTTPQQGDVVVFWRGSKSGWQGHVAFVVSVSATHVKCLGGNQGNAVNMTNYPKSQVLGYRTYA
tara:strand:+ start:329 stop:1348 length:1020 start_codon:yes stop_codon:yes gene_type:complete